MKEHGHVVVAGVSTRAAARSAALAGYRVTAIDAFGDADQHPEVRSISLGRSFSAGAAARTAAGISCDAFVYLANFENHPKAVAALETAGTLWGNPADVVQRVRQPALVAEVLGRRGFQVPEVRLEQRIRLKPDTTRTPDPDTTRSPDTVRLEPDTTGAPDNVPPVVSGFSRTTAGFSRTTGDFSRTTGDFSRTTANAPTSDRRWLSKPVASGGGQRIQFWTPGATVPPRCYVQEFIDGAIGSVVFVAAGGRVALLGVSRQLVGEQSFGAEGFQYCGNILAPAADSTAWPRDEELMREASRLAEAITDEFHLVGVNGIDFIAREGALFAVEVNPRWCASMELVEQAYGVSVFSVHAAACESQALPAFDLAHARRDAGAFGKAVVYARRDITVGDTRAWLDTPQQIRDVPRPGEQISCGRPVCTVFASGRDATSVHRALVEQAHCVYEQLEAWDRNSA